MVCSASKTKYIVPSRPSFVFSLSNTVRNTAWELAVSQWWLASNKTVQEAPQTEHRIFKRISTHTHTHTGVFLHITRDLKWDLIMLLVEMVGQNKNYSSICYWFKVSKQHLFLRLYFTHLKHWYHFLLIVWLRFRCFLKLKSFSTRWHKCKSVEQ